MLMSVEVDESKGEFFPDLLSEPELIEKQASDRIDYMQAANVAYLHRMLQNLLERTTEGQTPRIQLPELVELKAKAEDLQEQGIGLTVGDLRKLAEAKGIPYERIPGTSKRRVQYLMSGMNWHKLCLQMGKEEREVA